MMLTVLIFVLVLIGMACVFVPLFLDLNDEINRKYEEQE